MANQFSEYLNIVPLVSPFDAVATEVASPFVNLATVNNGRFFIFFGTLTGASAADMVTVTMQAATTSATTTLTAVAFNYRLSGAVGANTMGAVTAASATGLEIATTDDDKILEISIDPAAIQAAVTDATHVCVVITQAASFAASEVAVWAELDARYKGATMVSAST
jgi:hypothetical protein